MGHVEYVVDDLEGEACFFAEGAEAGDGVGVGGVGGAAWFGFGFVVAVAAAGGAVAEAEAVEATGDDAGGDEGPGFGAVDGFDECGSGGGAFGFDVHDLAADHAGGEFGVEVAYAANAGADGEGDIAEDGDGGGG